MATGMLNTANAVKDASVLRSGEKVAMLVSAAGGKNAKTFYHQIPGAKFIMPDGLELQFMGGAFTTDDPAIIAELGKIADRGTSMIYTRKPGTLAEVVAKEASAAQTAITDTTALTAQNT